MKDNLRKRFGFLLLSLVICVGITAMPKAVFAADTDIYWGIDDNNKMWISHNPLDDGKKTKKEGIGKWPYGGTSGRSGSDSDMYYVTEVELLNKIVAPRDSHNLFDGFNDCVAIKGLNYLDTSNTTDMGAMFYGCKSLESLDLSSFDTSKVKGMYMMFNHCEALKEIDVSSFDTSNVGEMGDMFCDCKSLSSLDVSNFDTSGAYSIGGMFRSCESLTSLDVSNFDTSNCTRLDYTFDGCKSLTSLDVSNFDTSKVRNFEGTFSRCYQLEDLDLSTFDTSSATVMEYMFSQSKALKSLDLSNFDTSSVIKMNNMFSDCEALESLDISSFNTSKVIKAFCMFDNCKSLKSLDLSSFDTSKMEEIDRMFKGCNSLQSLDLSNFKTSRVIDAWGMFYGCFSLEALDLSNFDLSKAKKGSMLNFSPAYNDPRNIKRVTLPAELNAALADMTLSGSAAADKKWYLKSSSEVSGDYNLNGYGVRTYDSTSYSDMAGLKLKGDTITYVAIDQLPVIAGEDAEVEYDTTLEDAVRNNFPATDKDGSPVDVSVIDDGGYDQQNAGKYSVTIAAVDSEGYESIKTVSITVKAKVCSPGEHQMIAIPEKAATCSAPGYRAYWKCEVCNKTFLDENGDTPAQNLITPKAAHEYGNWTKLDDKQHQRVCLHDNAHIEKANHAWDAGKVTRKATTTATGIKTYTCTVCKATKNVTIAKLPKKTNPLAVKGKTATLKYKKLKKKAQTLSVSKVITFTKKGQGAITYTKASGNKKIIINKKNGKITVKKGLKKGTYKVKVKVAAAGNNNYKATVKTITVTIKVK